MGNEFDHSYGVSANEVRWKRRVLKQANPGTFQVLGSQYARDDRSVYFKGKKVRLKAKAGGRLEAFRQIGAAVGTDGAWLYFGTKQLAPPEGAREGMLESSLLTFRPFHGDVGHSSGVNLDDGVLSDGKQHFLQTWSNDWCELETAQAEPIEPDLERFGHGRYFQDGQRVIHRGEWLIGTEGKSVRAIAPLALDADGDLYVGSERVEGYDASRLTWIAEDWLHAGDRILRIDGRAGTVVEERRVVTTALEDAAAQFLAAMIPRVASVCDRYLPVATPPGDMDLDVPAPGGSVDYEIVSVTAESVTVRVGDEELTEAWGAWYVLCCSAWGAARAEPDRIVPYAGFGLMLPRGDEFLRRLLRHAETEALQLASALFLDGNREAARVLTHRVLVDISRREGLPGALLQHLAHGLASTARYTPRAHSFEVTTNLAVTKHIVQNGWLEAEEPRVRLEMIATLVGAVLASKRGDKTLALAVPAMMERLDGETNSDVLTALDIALDALTVKATVMADTSDLRAYGPLQAATERLIERRVNVHINRVRLIEALAGQGLEQECEEVEKALLAEVPDGHPCPGPYVHREVFPSFAAAVQAARERAI